MNLEREIARHFTNGLPEIIFDLLLEDEKFVSFTNLSGLNYPDIGVFEHEQVLAKVQEAYEGDCPVTLINQDEVEYKIERLEEGTRITPLEGEHDGRIVYEFQFLDPENDVRMAAFNEAAAACMPSLISESYWQATLADGPLSEFELISLVSDIHQSPNQLLASFDQKYRTGSITANDLIPTSLSYYETLVGPCPTGQDVDSYITQVLIPHQSNMLIKSIDIGLNYILPTNIDQRLSPAAWLTDIPLDALLPALENFTKSSNPFVLFGILEIALLRVNDNAALESVIERITKTLVGGNLPDSNISKYYQIMPSLLKACLYKISVEKELWGMPPYWRRLVAFSHAHFLFDILISHPLNIDSFIKWCDGLITNDMVTAQLLDMQLEPLWQTDALSKISLQAEVVGRIALIEKSLKVGGVELSDWLDIKSMVDELNKQDGFLYAGLPGPMEGGQRLNQSRVAETTDSESMKATFKEIFSDLERDPSGPSWFRLYISSKMLRFDQDLLEDVTKATGGIIFPNRDEEQDKFFDNFSFAASIAAAQSCEKMADAVIDSLLKEANKFDNASKAKSGYLVILMVSAAFVDKKEWLEWLERRMADYSFSLPKGSACCELLSNLETLQVFFPVKERCFGRARKFASSALN